MKKLFFTAFALLILVSSASAEGTWRNYTNGNYISDIAVEGDFIWCAAGGVVRWDTQNGTYVKYSTLDGLADNRVLAVTVDAENVKWFGTLGGGVTSFDGTIWKTYTTEDVLADNDICAIAVDTENVKWFGTWVGGVSSFDETTWTTYTEKNGLADNHIRAIAVDAENVKWFGTWGGGVSSFDGTTWTTYTTKNGLTDDHICSIAIDADNVKWFGTWVGGISSFDGTTWTTYTVEDGLADNYIRTIAIGTDNVKWFGTHNGISSFDGKNWKACTIRDGLANNHVNSIVIDIDNVKWFGTKEGLSTFDGTTWKTYTTEDRIASNLVNSIAVDARNVKWFGTERNGVTSFNGATWKTYTTEDRLASNWIQAVAIDAENVKWFGTRFHGASSFDGTTWKTYTTEDGLASDGVFAIAVDAENVKWFGTGGGVSSFDGTIWKTYTTEDGLADNYILAIAVDTDNVKWFGTGFHGVSSFDGITWKTYTTEDGIISDGVIAIAVDVDNVKWFGTGGGVSRFDGTTWTTYTTKDELAKNYKKAIAVDTENVKWLGTYDNGVSSFDGTTWAAYTTKNGLASNRVSSIAVDADNVKWFGTGGGVSSFDKGRTSKHSRKLSPDIKETKLSESADGNDMRALLEQKYLEWRDYNPPDTIPDYYYLVDELHIKYNNNNPRFHDLVKLGPPATPYLLEKIENPDYFVYLHILYHITKWRGDYLKYQNYPSKLMFGKKEGKYYAIKRGKSNATEFWNRWWNEFRPNIKQHFEERYSEWKALKNANKTEEAQKKYERIVALGIDAIPWMVEKISEGDSEFIDALSFLTDGELNKDAAASETVVWWKNNKEKLTIPDVKIDENPDQQTEVKIEKLPTEREYKNEKNGFKVFVPKNWVPHILKKEKKSSRWLIAFSLPKVWGTLEKQFIENVVSVAVYENIISLESLVEIENNRIKDMLISKQKVNFQRGKAFIVFTEIKGLKYKTKYYLIYFRGKGFTLSFTSTRGTYDKNIGLFERFVETLRFYDSSLLDRGQLSKPSPRLSTNAKDTDLRELADGRNMRALLKQKVKEWRNNLPPETYPLRNDISPGQRLQHSYDYKQFHDMVKLGPRAVPYLLEKIENEDYFVYLYVLYHITKWRGDNLVFAKFRDNPIIANNPDVLMFASSIKKGKSRATEFWNHWWNEFRPNINQHFEKRYSEWKTLKAENKTEEAEEKYQRIVDLGIDAIPYMIEKISEGDSEFIHALSFLTDGELKNAASASETIEWWNNSREKWTIPGNRKWGPLSKGLRCSIAVDKTQFSKEDTIFVSVIIENVSGNKINSKTISAFRLMGRYCCPVDIVMEDRALPPNTCSLLFLESGDYLYSKINIAKHGWDHMISSRWPSRNIYSLVPPGQYKLQLEIEVSGGHGRILSNKIEITINE